MRGAMARPDRATADEADLAARVAALERDNAELKARMLALEAQRGVRDANDERLLRTLVSDAPFTCAQVLRHARFDAVLAEALVDADIDNAKQLGKLLARLRGIPVPGIAVAHVRLVHGVVHWGVWRV